MLALCITNVNASRKLVGATRFEDECSINRYIDTTRLSEEDIRKLIGDGEMHDLNGDGMPDCIITEMAGFAIYLKEKDGYWKLYYNGCYFLGNHTFPSVQYNQNGTFIISFSDYDDRFGMSTVYAVTVSYVFRFQNNEFYLIGERTDGIFTERECNFESFEIKNEKTTRVRESINYLTHKKVNEYTGETFDIPCERLKRITEVFSDNY